MPLLKLHWVATYGFIPAVIALILAVVLVSDIHASNILTSNTITRKKVPLLMSTRH